MIKETTNNKTIAKNTIYLYIRMLLMMGVSLYTSRIVLINLGVENYGIYQAVGGIVGFLDMVNGFMVNGVMRFLTFEMGKGDKIKLHRTFCTAMYIQIGVAITIVLLAESIGLWFLFNKLVIPDDRLYAAFFVLQFSIITAVFNITQVPYTSIITSREKMGVFAGITIFDSLAKLAIVLVLPLVTFIDSLILYGFLLMIVSLISMSITRIYCIGHFEESKFKLLFDKDIFKQIASYSLWNVISTFGTVFSGQGMVILTNMFFSPAIVAARSISLTVSGQATRFVQSFRQAINPQIVKSFAAGDIKRSHSLLLTSTKFSFYLVLLISLPLYLLINPVLNLWLKEVPDYTLLFAKVVLIENLFSTIVSCFYTAIYAKGRLKEFVLTSSMTKILMFPIVYILFKLGYDPITLSWASLIANILIAVIIDPIILVKIAGYTYKEIYGVILKCFIITIIAIPIPYLIYTFVNENTIKGFIIILFSSISCVLLTIFTCGLDKNIRTKLIYYIKEKVKRKN